jgi:hypothetical protein
LKTAWGCCKLTISEKVPLLASHVLNQWPW